MASSQALGAGLQGYNPFLPPDTNAKLRQIQMQQQLGQELQQQGLTPLDTNNRMMGNIAYKISPTEGLSKLADALLGTYEQQNANSKYADAIQGMGGTGGQPNANMMAALYPEEAAKAMLGDHRPGASYWTPGGMQQSPTDLQINTGTIPNQQPAAPPVPPQGDPGGGTGAPQVPVQGPQALPPMGGVPPVTASALTPSPGGPQPAPQSIPNPPAFAPDPGITLPGSANGAPPPQAAFSAPPPNPGESAMAYQARLEVAKNIAAEEGKVVPAGKSGYAAERGKQLAGTMDEIQNQATDSITGNNFLNAYDALSNNSYSGLGAPERAKFMNALQSAGVADPEASLKAGNTEAKAAIASRLVAEMNNTGGSGHLFQRITNNELGFLQTMAPGIEKTPQGQAAIVSLFRTVNNVKQQIGTDAAAYSQVHSGQIDDNFLQAERQKFQNMPLFDPAAIKAIQGNNTAQQGENSSLKSTLTKNIDGVNYQKINGQWFSQ